MRGDARPIDPMALRDLALAAGLDAVGFASAAPFPEARVALETRKAAGLHAGMGFTYNKPARSTDPELALAGARSLVVGAIAYAHHTPPPPSRPRPSLPLPADPEGPGGSGPWARVGAYARRDHYDRLRRALRPVAVELKAAGYKARVVVDDNALVDRPAAQRAGLGWFGKNSNLLHPGWGSWFVLGSVITTAVLPPAAEVVTDGCGSCRRCLDGCPTGAIVEPGVVDARRCLSWLLQQPGDFPRQYRQALGDRIYGCDDCQEVCPPGRRAAEPDGPEQWAPVVVGSRVPAEPVQTDAGRGEGDGAWVSVLELLTLPDDDLLARHRRWYIAGNDPRWVRRNALLVLGNRGDPAAPAVVELVQAYLDHPDHMLRSHAAWAARRLGRGDLLAGRGHDPAVAAELVQVAPTVASVVATADMQVGRP